MPRKQAPPLVFTTHELDLLGRTADALSAYMGKPVLAEVIDAAETGYEWVIFGVPLAVEDDENEHTLVQIGGVSSRIIGNKGGLSINDGEIYECDYLWAIQLSAEDGARFIKVDHEGEETAWADDLTEILPFALLDDEDMNDEVDEDDNDEDDEEPDSGDPSRTLH